MMYLLSRMQELSITPIMQESCQNPAFCGFRRKQW